MISNIFSTQGIKIKIEHQKCSDPSWCNKEVLFVESCSKENNILSAITVDSKLEVFVYWESHGSAEHFEVFFAPETDVLFIGAGSVSVQINVSERKLVGVEYPFLFWSYERLNDFILELGEIECHLYDLKGKRISSVMRLLL